MDNRHEDEKRQLPIDKEEDVEFTAELADGDDFEALDRAGAADYRQENRSDGKKDEEQ